MTLSNYDNNVWILCICVQAFTVSLLLSLDSILPSTTLVMVPTTYWSRLPVETQGLTRWYMNTAGMKALCLSPIWSPALSIQQMCSLLAMTLEHLVSKKTTQFGQMGLVSVKAKRHTHQTHCNQCFWFEMGTHFEQNVSVPDKDDIRVTDDSGDVCFHSAWDISSSANVTLTTHPVPQNATQKKYCFKPNFRQICTTLSVSFPSGNCSLPFVETKNITASGMSLFLSSLIFSHPLHLCLHPVQKSLCSLLMCALSPCCRVFEWKWNWSGTSDWTSCSY